MLTPNHMFGVQFSRLDNRKARAGLLVSSWNVCRGSRFMVSNTAAMKSSGTALWNRSDIELTNTRLGSLQRNGRSRASGWTDTENPFPYFSTPIRCNRRDILSA